MLSCSDKQLCTRRPMRPAALFIIYFKVIGLYTAIIASNAEITIAAAKKESMWRE